MFLILHFLLLLLAASSQRFFSSCRDWSSVCSCLFCDLTQFSRFHCGCFWRLYTSFLFRLHRPIHLGLQCCNCERHLAKQLNLFLNSNWPYQKRWRLYILLQYIANLTGTVGTKESHIFLWKFIFVYVKTFLKVFVSIFTVLLRIVGKSTSCHSFIELLP